MAEPPARRAEAPPRTVLVVESRAHVARGHFPVLAANVARGYVALGHEVELLTSLGWARHHEHPATPFAVRRWRRWARAIRRRTERPWVVTVLEALEIRARARRMARAPDLVVVLAWSEIPELLTLLAPTRARWLVDHWGFPHRLPGARAIEALARRRAAQRRASGGRMRLVVAYDLLRVLWEDRAPYLDPVVAPIACAVPTDPVPDARATLGFPSGRKLALLFGDARLKRRDVVLDAFARLDDWTLVVAGPVADGVAARDDVVTFPGVVHDAVRDALYTAADVVVLSFVANYQNESGTLMEAISFGVPVVCCDDAAAARIVEQHHLGTTYAGDDPDALAAAVATTPLALDPHHLAAARAEHSNVAIARQQLRLLDVPQLSQSPRTSRSTSNRPASSAPR